MRNDARPRCCRGNQTGPPLPCRSVQECRDVVAELRLRRVKIASDLNAVKRPQRATWTKNLGAAINDLLRTALAN